MATWKLPPLPPMPKAPPVQTPNVQATGAETLIAKLQMLPALATANALNNLMEVGQGCMDDSKENYCPFLFGILQESGVVFASEDGTEVILSYGGPGSGAEDYALEQHENMSYHHPIGGPKYLERPVAAWTPQFVDAAGQGLRSAVQTLSTGWASGDWQQIRVIRERPAGKVIGAYTRGKSTVSAHYRRTKVK